MNNIETRIHLNQIAETSGNEINTHNFIVDFLTSLNPTNLYKNIGGYAILAEFEFSKNGKTCLFRADIDAVGMNKETAIHSCGHDGHTTILLDLARKFKQKPLSSGRVLLLFQASEENGKGAKAIIDSKILQNYSIDFSFALHNIPSYSLGTIICKTGSFSCAVISCEMKFIGKTAHASEPENSISPLNTIYGIIAEIQKLQNTDFTSDNYFLPTLIELHLGEETYGVAPGNGLLRWTFRAKTNHILEQNISKIKPISEQIVLQTKNLNFTTCFLEAFYANENNTEAVAIIKKASRKLNLNYLDMENGFRWGEDFGLLTQLIPGAMFGIGAGTDCPPLHSNDYRFPDEIIEIGSNLFYEIAISTIEE